MSVVINEIEAEVSTDSPSPATPGDGAARPAEAPAQQLILSLLELNQERRARLGID